MERSTPVAAISPPDVSPPNILARSSVSPGGRRRSSRYRRPRRWLFRVPWTIYGYIAGEVFQVFLASTLAVSLIYVTFAAFQGVRSGLQLGFIWPLLIKTGLYPLYFSIPIAYLFAVTLVLGRLASTLEVAACRCHGISHFHIFAPVLLLGSLLALVTFYLSGWVVPDVHYEKRNLQTYILSQLEHLGSGMHRTVMLPDDGGTLWIGRYEGTQLWNVRVDLVPGKKPSFIPGLRRHLLDRLPNKVTLYASEGSLEIRPDRTAMVLILRAVEVLVPEMVRGGPIENEVFHQKFTLTDVVRIPLSFQPKSPGTKDRSTPELLRHIRSLRREARDAALNDSGAQGTVPEMSSAALLSGVLPGAANDAALAPAAATDELPERTAASASLGRKLSSALTEFHRRLAFTITCLTFPLLGVSLSLLLHSWGRIVPFFLGNLVVIVLFYPLLMVGITLGDRGIFPALSLTLPNVAILALGAYLARKVVRE